MLTPAGEVERDSGAARYRAAEARCFHVEGSCVEQGPAGVCYEIFVTCEERNNIMLSVYVVAMSYS